MNFYEIRFDVLHYTQTSLDIEDESRWALDDVLWARTPLLAQWQPLVLSKLESELKLGAFFTFYTGGVLGMAAHVLEIGELKEAFLSSGELLPVAVDGKLAYLFHCLYDADNLALDECDKWQRSNGRWVIDEAVFIDAWNSDRRFFRISGNTSLYCAGNAEWDFAECCKRHNLTGLELTPQRVISPSP